MKSDSIQIHGLNYHMNVWGDPAKGKLFFLHGFMDTGTSFEFVAEQLQDRFFCIAPDLRGFGRTDWTSNPLGYFFFEYIADVHAIFAHYSPDQPVNVVGHSMGGNIISIYAGVFPERVRRMVNVEGFGIRDMPPESGPTRLREWVEELQVKPFPIYPSLSALADRLQKANPQLRRDRADYLAKEISRDVPGGVQVRFDPRHRWIHPYLYQMQNVREFWKKITANCLLVMGANSSDIQKETEQRLSFYPKDSKRVTIPDCGHMVHHEKPDELAKLIRDFIKVSD
jgi:pimeloyl-ACP methyl ester carboxylesterase